MYLSVHRPPLESITFDERTDGAVIFDQGGADYESESEQLSVIQDEPTFVASHMLFSHLLDFDSNQRHTLSHLNQGQSTDKSCFSPMNGLPAVNPFSLAAGIQSRYTTTQEQETAFYGDRSPDTPPRES
jgi:hypothetical protein